MEPIYYYYSIDAKGCDRTYTIEFTANDQNTHERIVQKTIAVAKSAFTILSNEQEKVKGLVSTYVQKNREEIKNISSLKLGDYLKLLNHLVEYEESENNRFKREGNIHEIEKLSKVLSHDPKPVLKYTDTSGSWRFSTYLGLTKSSDSILLKVFEKSTSRSLLDLEFNSSDLASGYASGLTFFKMLSFDQYLSQKK